MELGPVLIFASRIRGLAALDRALASRDDVSASGQVPTVRVECLLCQVGHDTGNTMWRGILLVLDILHNGNGLNDPVRLQACGVREALS